METTLLETTTDSILQPTVEIRTSLKAVCSRKDLFEAAQVVGHAVSGRSPLPISSHVLVKHNPTGLTVMASDTELTISTEIPAQIEEEGGLTVPSKLFGELLGSLSDGEVALSVDLSNAVRMHCDRSDYKLLGLPTEDYPHMPEVPTDNHCFIPQTLLRNMIRKTIFAVSQDEARAILTGVLIILEGDTLKMVATDTHRLAVRTATLQNSGGSHQVIVPARALNEIARLLTDADGDVEMRMSDHQIFFRTPARPGGTPVTLISNLIQGQFPNYQRVIPTTLTRKLVLETGPFSRAVKRASIVARNNAHRIVLRTQDDKLTITAESSIDGAAHEEVDLMREGDDIEIAFNAKYLGDFLNVVDEDGFQFELTESLRPGLVRPVPNSAESAEDYICILMPMQII